MPRRFPFAFALNIFPLFALSRPDTIAWVCAQCENIIHSRVSHKRHTRFYTHDIDYETSGQPASLGCFVHEDADKSVLTKTAFAQRRPASHKTNEVYE